MAIALTIGLGFLLAWFSIRNILKLEDTWRRALPGNQPAG